MNCFLRRIAGAASSSNLAPQTRQFATGKRRIVPRSPPVWKDALKKMQWPALHKEMIDYFQHFYATRDSTVEIHAEEWPRFVATNILYDRDLIPCSITKHGPECRAAIPKRAILEACFDDEDKAHLSHLHKGRLFRTIFKFLTIFTRNFNEISTNFKMLFFKFERLYSIFKNKIFEHKIQHWTIVTGIHVPTENGVRTEEAVITYVRAHPVPSSSIF